MSEQYTAAIIKDADAWIGWIEEVPGINCLEASREALQKSLTTMLEETLLFNRQETFNISDLQFKEQG